MKPVQLAAARWLGAPTIHPDGSAAVVAVRRIDFDADDYTSQLWRIGLDGPSAQRQISYGWRDSAPAYSPDGEWLAFLRVEKRLDGSSGKPAVWIMPTVGGEPRPLAEAPSGVEAFVWAPDSARLAYLTRDQPEGRDVEPDKQPPRRITTFIYRRDGSGFLDGPRQIWVVARDGGAKQVSWGDVDHTSIDWSTGGDLLAFTAAGHDRRGDDLRCDVWTCHSDGSNRRALTSGGLSASDARFTADASAVVFTGAETDVDGRSLVAKNESLWMVPADASGPAVRLTAEEPYNCGAPIAITDDGTLFPNENRGAIELLLIPASGGRPVPLITGHRQVQAADVAGGRIVATYVDDATWGELLVREADATERVVTSFNAGYAEQAPIFRMTEVAAEAADGYPVPGWIVRPAGDGPHPLLLLIHGGPFAQYGWTLFDEAQVYAGAGYAVLMANPRGSSGYGQAHGRAILGNVGEVSAGDLMALLDHVCKVEPDIDQARLGVLGGSHGGYMTTWLAAHHGDRFRAAVSERAVNAIDSFTGSSDIGWMFADDLYGPDPAGQARQTPLTYADRIGIPMLIIHSEQDWRCPIEQAQRLFVALRKRGATAEMLIFPGEGHEMSRSGLPSHRLARFDAILDWFARHMPSR